MDSAKFVKTLGQLRTNSTFLTLKGYRNSASEVANYSLCFHMSYKSALQKSIETLQAMTLMDDLERQARHELVESFQKSLDNNEEESIEERTDAYEHFQDDSGNWIKGVKRHIETGAIHIYGLLSAKRILIPGNYPPAKNRRPLTIAKDKLRSKCAVSRFRQFKLLPDQVDEIVVENLSLLPPE